MDENFKNQEHYAKGGDPLVYALKKFSHEEVKGFLKINILKYISRADLKDGLKDYAKADIYAQWLDEFERTGTIAQFDTQE